MNKLQEFLAIINSKIGAGYVYGGQSERPLTKEALSGLAGKFGKANYYFNNYSAEKWLGYQYFDCSGLIVYALRRMSLVPMIADYSAQSIFSVLCAPVNRSQLRPGDICFKNTAANGIVHCGVYTGGGRVTHARGTYYGVVNTQMFDSFNTFGRLKYFPGEYNDTDIRFEQKVKAAPTETNIYDLPDETSAVAARLKAGNTINISASLSGNWYMASLTGKTGYVKQKVLADYAELVKALEFISQKTGIDKDYWYEQALKTRWLDACFIKIAEGFGGFSSKN